MTSTKSQKAVKRSTFTFFNNSSPKSIFLDVRNPFLSVLELDLWILLTARYYYRRLVELIVPMLKIISIVSFGITLILTFLLIHSSLNKPTQHELAVGGQLQTNNYLLQQELERLRSITLSLELAMKEMNSQLNAVRVESKTREEILADFASESAGGSIIDTPGTESFHDQSQFRTLFGIPIWKPNYFTPRKVIQPWSQAGECWAFHGTQGKIEIELAYSAYINRVTLEHIPASASLTGSIDSAPRDFRVLGKFRGKYVELGRFMYRDEGPPSQTFQITREDVQETPTKQVMLQILSNWGNPDYTCVYRFKVHGKMSNNLQNI